MIILRDRDERPWKEVVVDEVQVYDLPGEAGKKPLRLSI
jgi:hypothetical protein